jgi:hypothetical protein
MLTKTKTIIDATNHCNGIYIYSFTKLVQYKPIKSIH